MNTYHFIITNFTKLTDFYTFHSIFYHLLYLIGIIPSTKYISLFVLIGSQILNYIFPKYMNMVQSKINYLLIDFIIHILPVVIIFLYNTNKVPLIDMSMVSLLLFSLVIYFIYLYVYLEKSVYEIYINPFKYLNIEL